MSFLDNLEDNLKALERQEERDPEAVKRAQERREADRASALARAPHVEALKTSPFTSELLGQCRVIGRTARVLVQFTWIGDNLRLDARVPAKGARASSSQSNDLPARSVLRADTEEKRLELMPTGEGIVGVYSVDGVEQSREPVDPSKDDAEALVRRWLGA